MTFSFDKTNEFFDETFTGESYGDAIVTGKEFQGCRFQKIQFSGGGGFHRCRFIDCAFAGCDLSNLTIKNCSFRDVQFKSNKLIGINWTEASTFLGIKFFDSVLNFAVFAGMDVRRIVIKNCVAHELDLAHANLSEANLSGTDWSGSQFLKTNLTKADLRGASNYRIHPVENTLKQTRFSLPEATAMLYELDIILDD